MDQIRELIEKYFEGATSAEEEATLRRFFSSADVPDEWAMYKPLFAYFDDEIKKAGTRTGSRLGKRKNMVLWIGSVAACVALIAGAAHLSTTQKKCPPGSNYIMIDGRCYTNAKMIHTAVQRTLREVSDDDDILPVEPSGKISIAESQLKEFASMFNE